MDERYARRYSRESEKNRLVNELRRYRLAQADMRQVLAAVESLTKEHHNGYLCRALETAIVVYLRAGVRSSPQVGTWSKSATYCGNCDGITAGGLPIAITMSL